MSDEGKDPRRVEAGKKAAETAKERYGESFHSDIGHKGGEARAEHLQSGGDNTNTTMSSDNKGSGNTNEDTGNSGSGRGRTLSHEEASEMGKKGAEARWGTTGQQSKQ